MSQNCVPIYPCIGYAGHNRDMSISPIEKTSWNHKSVCPFVRRTGAPQDKPLGREEAECLGVGSRHPALSFTIVKERGEERKRTLTLSLVSARRLRPLHIFILHPCSIMKFSHYLTCGSCSICWNNLKSYPHVSVGWYCCRIIIF